MDYKIWKLLTILLLQPLTASQGEVTRNGNRLRELKLEVWNREILENMESTKMDSNLEVTLDLIKEFEGFDERAYVCPSGQRTIGYGFTDITWNRMSAKDADSILRCKFLRLKEEISLSIPYGIKDHQLNALTSFVYNVGITAYNNSEIHRKLRKNEINSISREIRLWVYARKSSGKLVKLRGLSLRREAELAIWEGTSSQELREKYLITD